MACYGDISFEPHGDQVRLYNSQTGDIEFVEQAEWACRLRSLARWCFANHDDLLEADEHILNVLCDCVQDMRMVLELVRSGS